MFVLLAFVKQTLKGTVAVSKLAIWLHHTGLPHGSCSYAIHKLNGFFFNNLGFKNIDLGVNDLSKKMTIAHGVGVLVLSHSTGAVEPLIRT